LVKKIVDALSWIFKPIFKPIYVLVVKIFVFFQLKIARGLKFKNYELRIKPGEIVKLGSSSMVVALPDGTCYTVYLANRNSLYCQCILTIDGRPCGTFQLLGNAAYLIERPVDEAVKFTFVVGKENKESEDKKGKSSTCVVSARFIPGVVHQNQRRRSEMRLKVGSAHSLSISQQEDDSILEDLEFKAGSTQFTGVSSQPVWMVDESPIDHSAAVTLQAYLVGK